MKYYTADTHFGHKAIISFENRPFSSVEEMNNKLIENWNRKVKQSDDIYILGDFCFYRNSEDVSNLLSKLSGNKHLIIGNHDQYLNKSSFNRDLFKSIKDLDVIHDKVNNKDYGIVLCHYPIQVWYNKHKGYLHLYGHIHSNKGTFHPMEYYIENSYNVGVDLWNYEPVTLKEILERKINYEI